MAKTFTKTEAEKAIVWTQPHGAQIIHEIDDDAGKILPIRPYDPNALYLLQDDQGHKIVMTGEELTSLAKQWIEFRIATL